MKKLLLLIVVIISGLSLDAQLRYVAGSQSMGLGFGITKDAKQLHGNYKKMLRNKIGVGAGISYEWFDFKVNDADQIYVNPFGWYMIKKFNEVIFFNIKGGLLMGYETSTNKTFDESKSGVYWGQNIGLNCEFYLTNKLTIDGNIEQRFFQKSIFGHKSYLISLTLNYKL